MNLDNQFSCFLLFLKGPFSLDVFGFSVSLGVKAYLLCWQCICALYNIFCPYSGFLLYDGKYIWSARTYVKATLQPNQQWKC